MAYGRPRYKRTINQAFVAGLEVDYQSGFGMRETRSVTIDRVLGTGHAVVKLPIFTPPGEGPKFKDVKFQLTGQDYAYELGTSRYKASIWLLTRDYLEGKKARAAEQVELRRRKAIGQELKEIPIYALTSEQMDVLEGIIQSFKTPNE